MFNTDKPIERIEDDLLNRSTFSKELANASLAYTETENFAISLCGEWVVEKPQYFIWLYRK